MLRLGYFKIKFGDNEQCSLFTVFTVFAPAEIVHQKNIYNWKQLKSMQSCIPFFIER